MLYKYNTLNKEYFKSGRYVEFEEYSSENTTNISRYINEGGIIKYIPRFYKVRLLHQLNNGYLDLTKDIWTKFVSLSRTTPYWFSNPNFIYYCPSQYKGKLVSILEIEDLYKFSLYGLPAVTLNNDLSYNFSIAIDAIVQDPNDNTLIIDDGAITIPQLRLETWFDDPTIVTTKYERTANLYNPSAIYLIDDVVFNDSRKYYKKLTGVNNPDLSNNTDWVAYPEYMSVTNIDKTKINSIINYRVTPVLSIVGGSDLYEGTTKTGTKKDLPDEFISKYSIVGSRRNTTEYDNIKFKRVDNNFGCDLTRGIKTYNEYILTNTKGQWLDNTLEISDIPYIFLREGTNSQTETETITPVIISSYTVLNKKPVLEDPTPITIDNFVLELFKITDVEEQSLDCVPVAEQTLNINFNINMSLNTQVKLYQNNELIYSINNQTSAGITTVIPNGYSTTIEVQRPGYKTINVSIPELTEETTISLAFIANLFIYHPSQTTYQLRWKGEGEDLPLFTDDLIHYQLHSVLGIYPTTLNKISPTSMKTEEFLGYVIEFILNQTGAIIVNSGTYLNITEDNQYYSYEGTIFTKYVR